MNTMPVVRCKRWSEPLLPKKILAIRLQALGDTIITLPYLQDLKRKNPGIELHFFTRDEVSAIPKNIILFDNVITIGGGRNAKLQFIFALLKLPYLWWQGYDVVLDLQKNKISRIIRALLNTKAWAEFDKYSPYSAGERTKKTIDALQLCKVEMDTRFVRSGVEMTKELLKENGYQSGYELVVLNPAGFCESRNWPVENYVTFAREWLSKINSLTQFVLLLLPGQKSKSKYIKEQLGDHCIDLTGKANQVQAFDIVGSAAFVLSEDSGLMHMAWVQGVPTIALFSSSRKDWSAPQGKHSFCFDSSDLECGPCMLEKCKFGDNRCLTRYRPETVIRKAVELITKSE
jgi:heptosyltransferase-2